MSPANTIDDPADSTQDDVEHQTDHPKETPDAAAFPNILNDNYANAASSETEDDLKKIKGIGPAIARTLNELGIQRFSQIAEMSEYDIDRVAQQLKGFRSRIYREDWIGQARTLQYQKNHNP